MQILKGIYNLNEMANKQHTTKHLNEYLFNYSEELKSMLIINT